MSSPTIAIGDAVASWIGDAARPWFDDVDSVTRKWVFDPQVLDEIASESYTVAVIPVEFEEIAEYTRSKESELIKIGIGLFRQVDDPEDVSEIDTYENFAYQFQDDIRFTPMVLGSGDTANYESMGPRAIFDPSALQHSKIWTTVFEVSYRRPSGEVA